MQKSYKSLSDDFFTCFLIFMSLTLISMFSSFSLLARGFLFIFILMRVSRNLFLILSIVFFVLYLYHEYKSQEKISKAKSDIDYLYEENREIFVDYFKKYIRLNLNKSTSKNDLEIFKSKFSNIYNSYETEILKNIEILKSENEKHELKEYLPEYITRLSIGGLLKDEIDINEFFDVKETQNYYIYDDDLRFIYGTDNKVYLLKELFIDRLLDLDREISRKL